MPESRQVFDLDSALGRLGYNRKLFGDLVLFFVEDAPGLLDAIGKGLENRSVKDVTYAAHSLKGLLASFDAHDAVSMAGQMEMAARRGELTEVVNALPTLKAAVSELQSALLPFANDA